MVSQVQAQEAIPTSCAKPNSPNELFWCLVKKSPEVQISDADTKIHFESISKAGQIPNPELEFEGVDNKDGGFSSEIALIQTIELGGKRSARKEIAKAELQQSKSEFLATKENKAAETAVQLIRLRQIKAEIEIANENLDTFKSIQKQYRRLGKLNPEQSVSSSVFEIAEQETALKKENLLQERDEILSEFSAVLGREIELTSELLVPLKKKWPVLSDFHNKGATQAKLLNNVSLASAELDMEKSDSWPDLSIGPKIEHQSGANSETKFGVALSIPLPILSANGGGRSAARMKVQKAELEQKLLSNKLKLHSKQLLRSYKSASGAVRKALKTAKIKKRHHKLHKLLNRGIIDSSLVIEMHREVFEFYERLHEQELKAINALWRIYAMRGTVEQEVFQ